MIIINLIDRNFELIVFNEVCVIFVFSLVGNWLEVSIVGFLKCCIIYSIEIINVRYGNN